MTVNERPDYGNPAHAKRADLFLGFTLGAVIGAAALYSLFFR
jgi:hypothetical protein